jgi:hypothetical protein
VNLDVTQVQLVASGRLIEVPVLIAGGSPPVQGLGTSGPLLSRSRRQWVTVTYTGGLTVGAVPYDVQQACIWVVSELLSERRNPTGAVRVHQGKSELEARLRGDVTGDSILLMQAEACSVAEHFVGTALLVLGRFDEHGEHANDEEQSASHADCWSYPGCDGPRTARQKTEAAISRDE